MNDFDSNAIKNFQDLYNTVNEYYKKNGECHMSIGSGGMINLLNMIASINNRLNELEERLKEKD